MFYVEIDVLINVEYKSLQLPYSNPSFYYWRSMAGIVFADKTLYIKRLETDRTAYRYLFLRPRRFGKTSFLNMLCLYYDIKTADMFEELFGPLYIGENRTPSANSHLVLKFDLSVISVSGSLKKIEKSFNEEINRTLETFLVRYGKELGYPRIQDLIRENDASASLRRVLVWLLHEHGANTVQHTNMSFH